MKTYAFSDLHGRLDLLKLIQKYANPEDKLICLGDSGDRGPEPWVTIKETFKDPRILYLKGNHEDMLVGAIEDYEDFGIYYQSLISNGGYETFEGWESEPCRKDWYRLMKNLPTHYIHTNIHGQKIILTHAGFTPHFPVVIPNEEKLLWDREHIDDDWPDDEKLKNTYIIHGHTPTPYLDPNTNCCNYIRYANGHKIDIDLGAVWSNNVCLVDLDDLNNPIILSNKI